MKVSQSQLCCYYTGTPIQLYAQEKNIRKMGNFASLTFLVLLRVMMERLVWSRINITKWKLAMYDF